MDKNNGYYLLPVPHSYFWDYLSIIFVKYQNCEPESAKSKELRGLYLSHLSTARANLGQEKVREVLDSPEYHDLVISNGQIYTLVDIMNRLDHGDKNANIVSGRRIRNLGRKINRENNNRFRLKNQIQKRFF